MRILYLCAAMMVFSFITACSPVSNYDPSNSVHVAQLETAQTLWAEESADNGDPLHRRESRV